MFIILRAFGHKDLFFSREALKAYIIQKFNNQSLHRLWESRGKGKGTGKEAENFAIMVRINALLHEQLSAKGRDQHRLHRITVPLCGWYRRGLERLALRSNVFFVLVGSAARAANLKGVITTKGIKISYLIIAAKTSLHKASWEVPAKTTLQLSRPKSH